MKRLLWLALFVICSSTVFAATNHLRDRSGNGHDLSQSGSGAYFFEGEVLFNDTSGTNLATNFNASVFSGGFTFLLKVKPGISTNTYNYSDPVGSSYNPRLAFSRGTSTTTFSVTTNLRNNTPNSTDRSISYGGNTFGQTYDIAYTYNSSNLTQCLYQNGSLKTCGAVVTGGWDITQFWHNFVVQNGIYTGSLFFNGSIYEYMLINTTYNLTHVQDARNGKYFAPTKIIAWYPFSGQGASCFPTFTSTWVIQGSDNCNVTRNFDMNGYNVTVNGTGKTTFSGNITNCKKLIVQSNSTVIINNHARAPCAG